MEKQHKFSLWYVLLGTWILLEKEVIQGEELRAIMDEKPAAA